MKTLTLRIENHSTLENGGPVCLTLDERGAQVGRKPGNDWVLPDPSRHISGHHFDISFENGNYILSDVSSNGTFLHGERYRLDGAYVIQDGNRFTVGHYIIRAQVTEGAAAPLAAPPAPPADEFDDVWGSYDTPPAPPAATTPEYVAPLDTGLQAPPVGQAHPPASAPTQSPNFDRFEHPHGGNAHQPPHIQSGHLNQSEFAPGLSAPNPAAPHSQAPVPPAEAGVFAPPMPPNDGLSANNAVVSQPNAPTGASDEMLQGFLAGAGITEHSQLGITPREMGEMLGRIARTGTQELMRMLQDRAAVKLFVSNEDRTMRVASGNNPMKFMPDTEQAFDALFVNPRDGYQTGADGFENALTDVRRHQSAVIAAMQPALADVLGGLSPEEIEENVGSGLMGGGRKSWDEFCKRWEQRAAEGENGMLDAFIKSFSKHYSDALRKL